MMFLKTCGGIRLKNIMIDLAADIITCNFDLCNMHLAFSIKSYNYPSSPLLVLGKLWWITTRCRSFEQQSLLLGIFKS